MGQFKDLRKPFPDKEITLFRDRRDGNDKDVSKRPHTTDISRPKEFNKLKFNLQEKQFPYFEDEDLLMLLDMSEDLDDASYQGCLMKAHAENDALGPIRLADNSKYWLRRAEFFRRRSPFHKSKNASGAVRRYDRQ